MNSYFDTLNRAIQKICYADQLVWFDAAIETLQSSSDPTDQLVLLITQTRRNMGNKPLGDTGSIATSAGPLYIESWSVTDAVRVALLLCLLVRKPNESNNIVNYIYKLADEAEHVSIVKGLVLYNKDDSLKQVALEAGRTNSRTLFSALCLNNPYPSAYYNDQEFNQLVLKALFTGLNIAELQNLQQRANQELSRMAEDYLDERVAADRSVPNDIWLALVPYRSERGEELLINAISDSDTGHRYYSAKSARLCGINSPEFSAAVAAQLEVETNDRVREILRETIIN